MRFSDSFLDDVRARVNIVDIVSEYVQLNKKGGKYWGICPFHNEKTASFSVDEQREMYYCFGCHKGGNAFNFLMEIERMSFSEAVEELAGRAGIALPSDAGNQGKDEELRKAILEANKAAAQYYHALLWEKAGESALSYLYARGIDDKTIRRFGLGVSPDEWQGLLSHMASRGFSEELCIAAGLAGKKNDRYYDVFRGRIMFPIINSRDQVLGFGGRIMGSGEPKYLNTSDTKVFFKRQGVYALNIAKRLRDLDALYLVEGYMDVIGLYQNGIGGAVATLGTALTPEQCRLLSRFTSRVVICYDGDAAGRQATLRALDIFEGFAVDVRVMDIPGGQDPDEYVKQHGKQGFLELPTLNIPQYRMNRLKDGRDLSLLDDRTAYAIDCAAVLRKVRNPVELDNYVAQLAAETGFSREVLFAQMEALPGEKTRKFARRSEKAPEDSFHKAEKIVLCALTHDLPRDVVQAEDFLSEEAQNLARQLLSGQKVSRILSDMEDETQRNVVSGIFAMDLQYQDSQQLLQIALQSIATLRAEKSRREQAVVKEALTTCAPEERDALMKKLMALLDEESRLEGMKGRVVTLE